MGKVKIDMIKKSVSFLLVFLLLFPVLVHAAGYDSLVTTIDGKKTKLTIEEHGYSEDHKKYTVTVGGYNVLLSGKFGNISDLMPFRVSIAWNEDEYITGSNYAVTTDPKTIVVFENEAGFPEEEPLYIIITPKNKTVRSSYSFYYIVSEERFHDAEDVIGTPAPTATPEPTPTRGPELTPGSKPTPVPARDPHDNPDSIKTVGEYVVFGRYPQTEEGNDNTPIEWLVLDYDEENQRVLLLSRYGLDAMAYHRLELDITWEKCDLRKWLNNDFVDTAFTGEERNAILTTKVDNGSQQNFGKHNGSFDTEDQVFLLSYLEANRYFGVDRLKYDTAGRLHPTDYAASKLSPDKPSSVYQTEIGETAIGWWLRSPGGSFKCATLVLKSGEVSTWQSVTDTQYCVRPAIWVDLNAAFFK